MPLRHKWVVRGMLPHYPERVKIAVVARIAGRQGSTRYATVTSRSDFSSSTRKCSIASLSSNSASAAVAHRLWIPPRAVGLSSSNIRVTAAPP